MYRYLGDIWFFVKIPQIISLEIANPLTHYIKSCKYLVSRLNHNLSITYHLQTLIARR